VSDHTVVAAVLRHRPEAFGRTLRLNQIWTEMGFPPGVLWFKQNNLTKVQISNALDSLAIDQNFCVFPDCSA
jgi:hypothetical protein